MSEKEKRILENVANFPPQVREKFLSMAQGASIALGLDSKDEQRKESGQAVLVELPDVL